jgi:hypothetical protein
MKKIFCLFFSFFLSCWLFCGELLDQYFFATFVSFFILIYQTKA